MTAFPPKTKRCGASYWYRRALECCEAGKPSAQGPLLHAELEFDLCSHGEAVRVESAFIERL